MTPIQAAQTGLAAWGSGVMRQQRKRLSFHWRCKMASNMLAFYLTATKATVSTHLISRENHDEAVSGCNISKTTHKDEETGWTGCDTLTAHVSSFWINLQRNVKLWSVKKNNTGGRRRADLLFYFSPSLSLAAAGKYWHYSKQRVRLWCQHQSRGRWISWVLCGEQWPNRTHDDEVMVHWQQPKQPSCSENAAVTQNTRKSDWRVCPVLQFQS